LDHTTGFDGRFGATFFITICCKRRGGNQLCRTNISSHILETARQYHVTRRWYLKILMLMPDHLHLLIGIAGDAILSNVIRDFKRITARQTKLEWQRNFFDHRLRHDESESEKADYIFQNPVRAALIREGEEWPYMLDGRDLDKSYRPRRAVR
jgi:putative transposase